ncbi:MAG: hypothetical protein AAGI36_00930 [Pseudomonadota bacterium]
MSDYEPYIPFSERNGFAETPPQLQLGEVSDEFRRQIHYCVRLEMDECVQKGFDELYFAYHWERVSKDIHVLFFKLPIENYNNNVASFRAGISALLSKGKFEIVFDFVEFLIRHPKISKVTKDELAIVFVQTRSAYRIVGGQIVAIGTGQQGASYEAAIAAADQFGEDAAKSHLVSAGARLRQGDWSGSVRESIHAVEAIVVRIVPKSRTLGDALKKIEQAGHLHKALKTAFSQLYGYTSEEEGVRHALVFEKDAKVDEADALFMLGACASFVSYLITRQIEISED